MSAFDTLNSALDIASNPKDKIFAGVVVSNADPMNIDRVQVAVPGLYDPDLGPIPWAGPIKNSPFGFGPSWGLYGVPAVGSGVAVILQDGDPNYPVYFHLHRHANPQFPSGSSWGFVDPYGNLFRVNADGNILLQATAGVTIQISPSGALSISSGSNTSLLVGGNLSIGVSGTTDLTSGGAVSISAPSASISSNVSVVGNLSVSGSLTNAGVNVGSNHRHSGVVSGPSKTGVPE